jgi:hypothetical protein
MNKTIVELHYDKSIGDADLAFIQDSVDSLRQRISKYRCKVVIKCDGPPKKGFWLWLKCKP